MQCSEQRYALLEMTNNNTIKASVHFIMQETAILTEKQRLEIKIIFISMLNMPYFFKAKTRQTCRTIVISKNTFQIKDCFKEGGIHVNVHNREGRFQNSWRPQHSHL